KELVYIGYLGLSPLSTAEEAVVYCRKSELSFYSYFGELAVMASVLREVSSGLGGDFGTTPTQAQMEGMVAHCQTSPLPADCKPEVIAPAVQSIATSYCSKPSAETDTVCQDINKALAETGGDPSAITNAITCFLDGKTYTAAGGCT
ncbi:MAG: hypothetical protein KDD22_08195, partial [Bdellovibrionales bacterium]|nr:hypothetical protein [Bdellovibrionales bacterium]